MSGRAFLGGAGPVAELTDGLVSGRTLTSDWKVLLDAPSSARSISYDEDLRVFASGPAGTVTHRWVLRLYEGARRGEDINHWFASKDPYYTLSLELGASEPATLNSTELRPGLSTFRVTVEGLSSTPSSTGGGEATFALSRQVEVLRVAEEGLFLAAASVFYAQDVTPDEALVVDIVAPVSDLVAVAELSIAVETF